MTLKKVIGTLHLWLGLTSGLLVLVIAITGAIYAFQDEIQDIAQPYRFVTPQAKPFLPPSAIREIADIQLPHKHIHAVLYYMKGRSANAIYFSNEDNYYYFVYINPYSGEVLKVKDARAGFFNFILNGHFYLWLPPAIGQPLTASVTLIFTVMVISGLVLWWPKNKNGRKQRFSIRWKNVRWRRRNYDLHNVVGFYVLVLALIFALTGLVWGFTWFRDAVYTTASGGKAYVEYSDPESDTLAAFGPHSPPIDQVWQLMQRSYPNAEWIEIHPPESPLSSIAANANPDAGTYWQTDYRYFDQYSLRELSVRHMWGRLHEASAADKLMRMNYDIHVGGILGLAGKVLAFCASLVVASLPVTGFMIWLGRRKKTERGIALASASIK